MYQNEASAYLQCMNQTLRQGLALLLIALLFRVLGGEGMGGVAGVLAVIGVVVLVVGLVRSPARDG